MKFISMSFYEYKNMLMIFRKNIRFSFCGIGPLSVDWNAVNLQASRFGSWRQL